jgi:hypothetical protein
LLALCPDSHVALTELCIPNAVTVEADLRIKVIYSIVIIIIIRVPTATISTIELLLSKFLTKITGEASIGILVASRLEKE